MRNYIKASMESGYPVWELPINDGKISDNSKYHCFESGKSLCGRYIQDTDDNDTDIAGGEIMMFPHTACQKCFKLWKRKYIQY